MKMAARHNAAAAGVAGGGEVLVQAQVNADGTASSSGSGGGGTPSSNGGSVNIVVAKYGARALENGGPLQDLRAILYQYMRPWRPSQTLHIGLVDPLVHSSLDSTSGSMGIAAGAGAGAGDAEGSRFVDHRQLYFQWCTLSQE